MTLHVTKDQIRCSELSQNGRMLFNSTLLSQNLVNYEYQYDEELTKLRFELKWLNETLQEAKVKHRIKFRVKQDEPDTLAIVVYGESMSEKTKSIKMSIEPEMVIHEPPDGLYYDTPITLHREDFIPFLKLKPSMKNGKVVKEEIEVRIQAPNYIKFTRLANMSESEKFGIYTKTRPLFKGNVFIGDLKQLYKLKESTNIFNIYQPKEENAPICIGGLCGEYGHWRVYIHPVNIKPVKEVVV